MAQIVAGIQIIGLEQLDAILRDLPDHVSGPIMHDALTAAGGFIRDAAAGNIHSRSGRTAADLRVEVQTKPAQASGVAAVGGTVTGTTGRAHVLRWLEFGARGKRHGGQGWPIVAGKKSRRDFKKALKALSRLDVGAAVAFRKGLASGRFRHAKSLKLPGGIFRASAKHPPLSPQSPLTRALAEQGDRAIAVFRDRLWAGIRAVTNRARRAA